MASKSPVYNVIAVPIEKIEPNTYNPNAVAPPEMKLLYDSIKQDGYTMPIVCYYDEEKDKCYLLPNVIFNEVTKFYAVQGNKFPGNETSTWKYLKQAGRLFPGEKDRNKTRKSINGKMITFVEVRASDVFGERTREKGDYINTFPVNPENHSKNISLLEDDLPF